MSESDAPIDTSAIDTAEKRLMIGEKALSVSPIKVGQIPKFSKAISHCVGLINTLITLMGEDPPKEQSPSQGPLSTFDVTQIGKVLETMGDDLPHLFEAIAVATRQELNFIEELAVDEFTRLLIAVVEMNMDFFVRRVLPSIQLDMTALSERLQQKSAGTTQSST